MSIMHFIWGWTGDAGERDQGRKGRRELKSH